MSSTTFRKFISDRMLDHVVDRSLGRQELERRIARLSPDTPGYPTAMGALRSARRRESVMAWLAWRLHPRTMPLP